MTINCGKNGCKLQVLFPLPTKENDERYPLKIFNKAQYTLSVKPELRPFLPNFYNRHIRVKALNDVVVSKGSQTHVEISVVVEDCEAEKWLSHIFFGQNELLPVTLIYNEHEYICYLKPDPEYSIKQIIRMSNPILPEDRETYDKVINSLRNNRELDKHGF
jgi:hypothetical protein